MRQNPHPRPKSAQRKQLAPFPTRRDQPLLQGRRQAFQRAALMSAYFHAKSPPGEDDGAPFFLKPWPIEKAVRFLARHADRSARNQAAAWLAESAHRDFQPHLQSLVGEMHGRLRDRLNAGTHRPSEEDPTPHAAPTESDPGRAAPPSRFESAYHFLTHPSGDGAACKRTNFHLRVQFDERTCVTSLKAQVDVNRPPEDFAVVADPQNWAHAAPLFFLESTRGKIIAGEFVKDPPVPPPIGSESWEGAVLENVIMSYNPFVPYDAENYLNARYSQHPGAPLRYAMKCNLYQCRETDVGLARAYGGLDVDAGEFEVTAITGGSRIAASKRVRCTDRAIFGVRVGYWFNKYAQYWLGPWGAALVYEAAC